MMKRFLSILLRFIALVALYMLIGWALDKHEWQKYKNLTKDEAQAEWESFLSDINDEEVNIADGGYVKVKFHEVFSMTNDENIRWYEGNIVG